MICRNTNCIRASERNNLLYCHQCYSQIDDEYKNNIRSFKEKILNTYLVNNTVNNTVKYNAKYSEPDWTIELPDRIIIIECNEFQHFKMSKRKELARMKRISSLDPKPTFFIHFNPDFYYDRNKQLHNPLFEYISIPMVNEDEIYRLHYLSHHINIYKDFPIKYKKDPEFIYLFYNRYNYTPIDKTYTTHIFPTIRFRLFQISDYVFENKLNPKILEYIDTFQIS